MLGWVRFAFLRAPQASGVKGGLFPCACGTSLMEHVVFCSWWHGRDCLSRQQHSRHLLAISRHAGPPTETGQPHSLLPPWDESTVLLWSW